MKDGEEVAANSALIFKYIMEMDFIKDGLSIGLKIAQYFGLIETVSTDVKKLVHQAFMAAQENLQYAQNATGQLQMDYICEAKNNFIKAVTVEDNENKIMALCGLSMCQCMLGDYQNARLTMNRINKVRLTNAEKIKAIAMELGVNMVNLSIVLRDPVYLPILQERKSTFENIRDNAISLNKKLLNS